MTRLHHASPTVAPQPLAIPLLVADAALESQVIRVALMRLELLHMRTFKVLVAAAAAAVIVAPAPARANAYVSPWAAVQFGGKIQRTSLAWRQHRPGPCRLRRDRRRDGRRRLRRRVQFRLQPEFLRHQQRFWEQLGDRCDGQPDHRHSRSADNTAVAWTVLHGRSGAHSAARSTRADRSTCRPRPTTPAGTWAAA